ncbi:MAG: ferrous iron transport protein B [Deltaproteobacteria bacterium]|nr:ferrous iron transport protein B [Deltaproteobacteria bacterium]
MKRTITIALSGNPNSGKTTLFNAITGARQHIANYPGVTVEKKSGKIIHKGHEILVVDLPGTYSLTAYSLEEIVTRDFLINERPDVVVDIVDASNLDRNLYLAVQFRELGVPLIIALNMMDMAERRGIKVDHRILSQLFKVPVIPMVARSNKGVHELLDAIIETSAEDRTWNAEIISYGSDIDHGISEIEEIIRGARDFDPRYPSKWLALKCLEGDDQILKFIQGKPEIQPKIEPICHKISKHIQSTLEEEPEAIIADHRYGYIAGITKKAVRRKIESRLNFSDQLDKILTNRILGPTIMMLILYGIYVFTFWGSEAPVEWFGCFFTWMKENVSSMIPEGNLQSLIVSGIIDGVGGVFGFIPVIMFMFFAIAILEDSGYMARMAYMLDRVLRWFGLHGNSVIALLVSGGISGGCAVPGVMATRTLRDPKERIATLLVVPFMNCGAKLPVFLMLIAAFFSENEARMMFLFTMISWVLALFAAKLLRATVLRGPKTPFVMELPPYRAPTIKGICIHTWERTWQYMKKAGTVILGISIILWAMMTFPRLNEQQARFYEDQRLNTQKTFLSLSNVNGIIPDLPTLNRFDELYDLYRQSIKDYGPVPETLMKNPLYPVFNTLFPDQDVGRTHDGVKKDLATVTDLYLEYRNTMNLISAQEQQAALKATIAGWIGQTLEGITRTIGFDYRTNIALVGGFAAKEIILSTLGTAYSLGEVAPEESGTLSSRLARDPDWNPLKAFVLILFTMLYVPCFVTVISIKKESSWRWALFSMGFNLILAYLVSFIIYQTGKTLGIGI